MGRRSWRMGRRRRRERHRIKVQNSGGLSRPQVRAASSPGLVNTRGEETTRMAVAPGGEGGGEEGRMRGGEGGR